MPTLLTVLACIAAFMLSARLTIFLFTLRLLLYGEKLLADLPWFTWITYQDVVDQGYSKLYTRLLIPHFHRLGYVEGRLLDGLSELETEQSKLHGFCAYTVHLYEFRLIKRRGRKRRDPRSFFSELAWQPATA